MNPPSLHTPPPLPSGKSFARPAVIFSILAPLLAILFGVILRIIAVNGVVLPPLGLILVGFVIFGLGIVGLGLAIAGLCNIPRHGARGILSGGILGVVLNGILLLFFVGAFIVGLNRRAKATQFSQNLQNTERELQTSVQKSYNRKTGITNIDIKGIERIRNQLDRGAQTLSGDDALIARAMSKFAAGMEEAAQKYQSAKNELDAAHVLDLQSLINEQQIASRREIIQRFMSANSELASAFSNAVDTVRANLASLHVSPGEANAALAGFESRWKTRAPLVLKIRDCDNRIGQGMLGILNLLDQNWGKWSYDSNRKLLTFEDTDARVAYKQFLAQIESAGQEQIRTQGELIAVSH